MTRHTVLPSVLAYFDKHPDVRVYLKDIAAEVGFTEKQVQGCIANIRRNDARMGEAIEVVVEGNVWIFHSGAAKLATGKRLFEELAVTRSGEILVQDEDGAIYKLTEL